VTLHQLDLYRKVRGQFRPMVQCWLHGQHEHHCTLDVQACAVGTSYYNFCCLHRVGHGLLNNEDSFLFAVPPAQLQAELDLRAADHAALVASLRADSSGQSIVLEAQVRAASAVGHAECIRLLLPAALVTAAAVPGRCD
jgi:hypothetical protein